MHGGHPARDHAEDGLGVDPDLVLRVGIGAQVEEVQQVPQVHLPVELRVDADRKRGARQLPRQPLARGVERRAVLVLVQHREIDVVGARGLGAQRLDHRARRPSVGGLAAALAVGGGLHRDLVRIGDVELALQHGVAAGVLVDAGGAVAEPLPRHEDRRADVQLEVAQLERRGVAVAHQVADQAAVRGHLAGAAAVGDARALHHGVVVAHVVDHPHEAAVEHGERAVQHLLHRGHGGARRRLAVRAGGLDVGVLLGRQAAHGRDSGGQALIHRPEGRGTWRRQAKARLGGEPPPRPRRTLEPRRAGQGRALAFLAPGAAARSRL